MATKEEQPKPGGPPPTMPPMGMNPIALPAGAAGSIGPQEPFTSTGRPIETINLVDSMPPEWLEKTGQEVYRLWKMDDDSRADYMKRRANQHKLFCGTLPPKSWPFDNCANPHDPIIAKAILRLQARIFDQLIPAKGDIFHAKPTGIDDEPRAKRIEKHMNWQVRREIIDWRLAKDKMLMQLLLGGSAFVHVYRDVTRNRNCVDYIPVEDFVVNYTQASTDPTMGDVSRKTRLLRKARHELEALEEAGVYFDIARLYDPKKDGAGAPSMPSEDTATPVTDAVNKAQGTEPPTEDSSAKRVLLEQHCWMKVPASVDGTAFGDKERPVCVTIDRETKLVLSIYIREDEDPLDRMRFDQEDAARTEQVQMMDAQYAEQIGMLAQDPMATEEEAVQIPQPEPPPETPPVRMRPIEYFVHYTCIPNPEGFYGIGVGYLLEGANEVANTVLSQIIDAATLANTATGFVNKLAKMKRGDVEVIPGKLIEVEPSGSLDDMIKIVQWPGPNPSMFQVVQHQEMSADGVSSASEVLSGEAGDRETATTTRIKASMALTSIQVMVRRIQMSLDHEIKMLARLNSVFLDAEKPFVFVEVNPDGSVMPHEVTRLDYVEDLDIEFTAESRMASQPQRIEAAEKALASIMSNPVLASMPTFPALVYAAQKKLFMAMDADDLVQVMGPPPPMMPLPPPGMTQGQPPMPGGPPDMSQPPQPGQAPLNEQQPDLSSVQAMAEGSGPPTQGLRQ